MQLGRRLAISQAHDLRLEAALLPARGNRARPVMPQLTLLPRDHGGAPLLAALLRTAISRMRQLTPEELPPLEISLREFLVCTVAANQIAVRVLDGSAAKNAIALRAMQIIALHLADPDLSPRQVAESAGISLRYLQQLFEAMGENAKHHIRRRRLERCFEDLRSPLYAALSIAEISFRWGFNDSAYFSRIFKQAYGVSPSQHRAAGRPGLCAA
jgi:AraC-like DNA-binding protein